ncbi:MAG: AI-2E family transporter [Acidobacteriales bacterium]|nr:AI-2E family transporter [Terriglobales bacterium]
MPADTSAAQFPAESGTSAASVDAADRTLPVVSGSAEEVEVLQASIRAGSVAQIVVATIAVIGLLYLLKLVLITTLSSVLLAFMLEPLVRGLAKVRIPRGGGSLVAVLLLLVVAGGLSYFFYNRAIDFAVQLPRYSGEIRSALSTWRSQTHQIEESTRVFMQTDKRKPLPVEVQKNEGLSSLLPEESTSYLETILALSFIPFLVYFMLTWKTHAHAATVRLFPKEHRVAAHRTVGRISDMIRSFIVGNMIIGLVTSGISIAIFGALHLPYFYFLGVISGFISLIPYLGVFLALLPPLAAGIGTLNLTGIGIVILSTVVLHVVSMNVLFPKIVGSRLRLNPLAVTLALLFWSWLWGGMGLILAVPILGATKVICDYVDPLRGLGNWLAE